MILSGRSKSLYGCWINAPGPQFPFGLMESQVRRFSNPLTPTCKTRQPWIQILPGQLRFVTLLQSRSVSGPPFPPMSNKFKNQGCQDILSQHQNVPWPKDPKIVILMTEMLRYKISVVKTSWLFQPGRFRTVTLRMEYGGWRLGFKPWLCNSIPEWHINSRIYQRGYSITSRDHQGLDLWYKAVNGGWHTLRPAQTVTSYENGFSGMDIRKPPFTAQRDEAQSEHSSQETMTGDQEVKAILGYTRPCLKSQK